MSMPLDDAQMDQCLRRDLAPPLPRAGWRERVLAATLGDLAWSESSRQAAVAAAHRRLTEQLSVQRGILVRGLVRYGLIGAGAIAVLPVIVERLQSRFGFVAALRLSGFSAALATAALAVALVNAFPRQTRALFGVACDD